MLRTPRIPLLGAMAAAVVLALTGVLAYLVPVAHDRDAVTLEGFRSLNRPRLTPLLDHVAHLADPAPYALIGLSLALVALARRRPRTTVAILVLLVVTGATTEALKQLLAHPRPSEWLGEGQIAAASWPSGHATASMTLALCAVLAVPARARPAAAGIGAVFAVAVSYAILALGWHFPSDVVGGFLVAGAWTGLAVALLVHLDARRGRQASAAPVDRGRGDGLATTAAGAGLAAVAAAAALAQPAELSTFAQEHTSFFVVAAVIAALATVLATGLARAVR